MKGHLSKSLLILVLLVDISKFIVDSKDINDEVLKLVADDFYGKNLYIFRLNLILFSR